MTTSYLLKSVSTLMISIWMFDWIQGLIVFVDLIHIFQVHRWSAGIFDCPPVFPVEHNGYLGLTDASSWYLQGLQFTYPAQRTSRNTRVFS